MRFRVVDIVLRALGCVVPIVIFETIASTLVGEQIFWAAIGIGAFAGLLLRTWWSLGLVPLVTLSYWLVVWSLSDSSGASGEFTLFAVIVVISGILLIMASGAAIGTWLGQQAEIRLTARRPNVFMA